MKAHVPDATRPISPGDIVSFRFPHSDGPGNKDRPCLVIHADDDTGEVILAYGTSIFSRERADYSLTVMSEVSMKLAKLAKPTRFLCERRLRVKRTDQRFAPNSEGDVVIGQFPAEGICWDRRYLKLPFETPVQERRGIHPPKTTRCHKGRGLHGRRPPRLAMVA